MQVGSSKHAAWRDERLDHDTRALTHQGPGAGRAESDRDLEPIADPDLGVLTGIHWLAPADAGARVQPLAAAPPITDIRRRKR
jgi:hypothetical protein